MPFVWRSTFWRALAYFILLTALLVPAILYWPNFRDNVDAVKSLVPESFKGLVDGFTQGGVQTYVCGQHFFKACNTLGIAAAVLFGMGAVAGEVQRGTLENWLARPVSRTKLLLERWASGALAISLPVYLSSALVPYLLSKVGESMGFTDLMLCSTLQSLLLIAVFSVTFLASTIFRKPTSIAFGMFFLFIFQFAIYLVKEATHYSMFRLVDFEVLSRICTRNSLPLATSLGLAGASAICVVLSLVIFARKSP